jgi:hypothetical protein
VKKPASIERPALFNPYEKEQEYSPVKPLSPVKTSNRSVKPFVIEEPPPVSAAKKPASIERLALFNPYEKEQDYSPVKKQTSIGRPALFKPDEKEQDDSSSDYLTPPPDERSPGRVTPPSVTSKYPVPTPPAWFKPKEEAVQNYQSIRSQTSEFQYSISYSKCQ